MAKRLLLRLCPWSLPRINTFRSGLSRRSSVVDRSGLVVPSPVLVIMSAPLFFDLRGVSRGVRPRFGIGCVIVRAARGRTSPTSLGRPYLCRRPALFRLGRSRPAFQFLTSWSVLRFVTSFWRACSCPARRLPSPARRRAGVSPVGFFAILRKSSCRGRWFRVLGMTVGRVVPFLVPAVLLLAPGSPSARGGGRARRSSPGLHCAVSSGVPELAGTAPAITMLRPASR